MRLRIQSDGGSRQNPGHAACAFVFIDESGNIVFSHYHYLGIMTNNEAEYHGLLQALEYAQTYLREHPADAVDIFLDSQLVVEQVRGTWKVKEPRLGILRNQVVTLLAQLPVPHTLGHVRREMNKEADKLVNFALDEHLGLLA